MKRLKLWSMLILIPSVLLLSAARNGHSQTPHNPRIKKPEQHAIPQNSAANSNSDERGSEKTPFAVKLLNTGKSQQETAQEAAQIQETDNTDWWIVRLAIVAAAVGFLQLLAFLWQGYVLKNTLIASERSADASIAANAAHLHLMRLWIEGPEGQGKDILEGAIGVWDPVLHYGFTNYGDTPAVLVEMCWQVLFAKRLPDKPAYDNAGEIGADLLVVAGRQDLDHSFKWSHLFGVYLTEDSIGPVRRMEERFYVYGFFRFRDVFDRITRVGFAYHFSAQGQAHVVAPDIASAYWYRTIEK